MDHMLSRRPRQRSRNFEMIMSGRHRFEIRDLSDDLTDENIPSLSLPKLPSDRNEIVVGGLVRSHTSNYSNETESMDSNRSMSDNINSSSLSEGSCEEEKLMIDNNSSEKNLKSAAAKENFLNSKNSSPGSSSRASSSWYCNAGLLPLKD